MWLMQTERLDLSDVKRNPEKPEALSLLCLWHKWERDEPPLSSQTATWRSRPSSWGRRRLHSAWVGMLPATAKMVLQTVGWYVVLISRPLEYPTLTSRTGLVLALSIVTNYTHTQRSAFNANLLQWQTLRISNHSPCHSGSWSRG